MWRNRYRLGLVFFATLLAASCGGGSAAPTKTTVGNVANLTLNSSALAFGSVSVGGSKTNSISLTNSAATGGPALSVTQVSVSGAGYTCTTPTLPMTLAAGQSATVSVTFAPKTGGSANGNLTIMVSGASQPISVPMTGSGLAPGQLSASPTAMTFGSVDVGKSQQQAGTLTAGGTDVNVTSANWNGQDFSLSGITFPTTVKAGSSTSFTVNFDPQTAGSSSGQVSFLSDATNSPAVVTFSGTGVQHSVSLSWNASTSQVIGYNIYRATSSTGTYTKLNSSLISGLSFTDSAVQGGVTYYYAATSVNSSSTESAYSNLATAIIP